MKPPPRFAWTSAFLLATILLFLATPPAGAQSPSIADRMQSLREGSVRITRQYLDLTRTIRGTNHPDYLDALLKYAAALAELDRDQEAAAPLSEALVLAERLYGASDARVLPVLNPLIGGLFRREQMAEATRLAERAVGIARASFAAKAPELAVWFNNLGLIYKNLGRFAAAETLMREAIAITDAQAGPRDPTSAIDLDNLSEVYRLTGRFPEALALKQRAVALVQRGILPTHRLVAVTVLGNLAALHQDMGNFDAAEAVQREALETSEKYLGANSVKTAQMQALLASLYWTLGRFAEAESFFQRGLATLQRLLGAEHPRVIVVLNNLAQIHQLQGRQAEAEAMMRQVVAISEKSLGADHYELASYLSNLGLLLGDLGKTEEAERHLRRAVAIDEKAFGRDHPTLIAPLVNLADLLLRRGAATEAGPLYAQALKIAETRLGADHPLTARAAVKLARLAFAAKDWRTAHAQAAKAGAITVARLSRMEGSLRAEPGDLDRTGITDARRIFRDEVQAAFRFAEADKAQEATLREAGFAAAQWGLRTAAAQALSQVAARIGAGDGALAQKVRQRQDLLARWQALDRAVVASAGQPDATRDLEAERQTRAELTQLAQRIAGIDQELARQYPAYAELAGSAPSGIADVQRLLKPDEALVAFFDIPKSDGLPEETLVWVVTRDEARWRRITFGTETLADKVKVLRCGLDAAAWHDDGAQACAAALGIASAQMPGEGDLLPFNAASAWRLYEALFKPDETLLAGKHLLVVPSGALTQLPLPALVTAPPGGHNLRSLPWLARSHAVTVLPAVSSLKALRALSRPSAASKPLIGFGNPLLDGADDRFVPLAERAQQNQACRETVTERLASLVGLRGVSLMRTRGGLADLSVIRAQSPLPETADELCAVARDVGADVREMRLGARATEREVKAMSANGSLAQYRIVHFATHGAMAGELGAGSEPGLILTPPANASRDDDAYLSASEIAGLRLDADWVILSACNTAAGKAANAEALSGLARAFIYAQARALLVSHWAVDSNATVKLITAAMREMTANPALGRAEALRRSMLALIEKGAAHEAHPAYWAPFVVVGEGGR